MLGAKRNAHAHHAQTVGFSVVDGVEVEDPVDVLIGGIIRALPKATWLDDQKSVAKFANFGGFDILTKACTVGTRGELFLAALRAVQEIARKPHCIGPLLASGIVAALSLATQKARSDVEWEEAARAMVVIASSEGPQLAPLKKGEKDSNSNANSITKLMDHNTFFEVASHRIKEKGTVNVTMTEAQFFQASLGRTLAALRQSVLQGAVPLLLKIITNAMQEEVSTFALSSLRKLCELIPSAIGETVNAQAVLPLAAVLRKSKTTERAENALAIISYCTEIDKSVGEALMQLEGFQILLGILLKKEDVSYPVDTNTEAAAARVLRWACVQSEEAKHRVEVNFDAVLSAVMRASGVATITQLSYVLAAVVKGNAVLQTKMMERGALEKLLKFIEGEEAVAASVVATVRSAVYRNSIVQKAVVEQGIVPRIAKMCTASASGEINSDAVVLFANLTCYGGDLEQTIFEAGAVDIFMRAALEGSDPSVVRTAVRACARLIMHVPAARTAATNAGGVTALLRTVATTVDIEIGGTALNCLNHIVYDSEACQRDLFVAGGVKIILAFCRAIETAADEALQIAVAEEEEELEKKTKMAEKTTTSVSTTTQRIASTRSGIALHTLRHLKSALHLSYNSLLSSLDVDGAGGGNKNMKNPFSSSSASLLRSGMQQEQQQQLESLLSMVVPSKTKSSNAALLHNNRESSNGTGNVNLCNRCGNEFCQCVWFGTQAARAAKWTTITTAGIAEAGTGATKEGGNSAAARKAMNTSRFSLAAGKNGDRSQWEKASMALTAAVRLLRDMAEGWEQSAHQLLRDNGVAILCTLCGGWTTAALQAVEVTTANKESDASGHKVNAQHHYMAGRGAIGGYFNHNDVVPSSSEDEGGNRTSSGDEARPSPLNRGIVRLKERKIHERVGAECLALLANLAVDPKHHLALVEAGAIDASIVSLLCSGDVDVIERAAACLDNLAQTGNPQIRALVAGVGPIPNPPPPPPSSQEKREDDDEALMRIVRESSEGRGGGRGRGGLFALLNVCTDPDAPSECRVACLKAVATLAVTHDASREIVEKRDDILQSIAQVLRTTSASQVSLLEGICSVSFNLTASGTADLCERLAAARGADALLGVCAAEPSEKCIELAAGSLWNMLGKSDDLAQIVRSIPSIATMMIRTMGNARSTPAIVNASLLTAAVIPADDMEGKQLLIRTGAIDRLVEILNSDQLISVYLCCLDVLTCLLHDSSMLRKWLLLRGMFLICLRLCATGEDERLATACLRFVGVINPAGKQGLVPSPESDELGLTSIVSVCSTDSDVKLLRYSISALGKVVNRLVKNDLFMAVVERVCFVAYHFGQETLLLDACTSTLHDFVREKEGRRKMLANHLAWMPDLSRAIQQHMPSATQAMSNITLFISQLLPLRELDVLIHRYGIAEMLMELALTYAKHGATVLTVPRQTMENALALLIDFTQRGEDVRRRVLRAGALRTCTHILELQGLNPEVLKMCAVLESTLKQEEKEKKRDEMSKTNFQYDYYKHKRETSAQEEKEEAEKRKKQSREKEKKKEAASAAPPPLKKMTSLAMFNRGKNMIVNNNNNNNDKTSGDESDSDLSAIILKKRLESKDPHEMLGSDEEYELAGIDENDDGGKFTSEDDDNNNDNTVVGKRSILRRKGTIMNINHEASMMNLMMHVNNGGEGDEMHKELMTSKERKQSIRGAINYSSSSSSLDNERRSIKAGRIGTGSFLYSDSGGGGGVTSGSESSDPELMLLEGYGRKNLANRSSNLLLPPVTPEHKQKSQQKQQQQQPSQQSPSPNMRSKSRTPSHNNTSSNKRSTR